MDIIIGVILLVFAAAMLFGKPIKIEITHNHIINGAPEEVVIPTPEEDREKARELKGMEAALNTLNTIMMGGEFIETGNENR